MSLTAIVSAYLLAQNYSFPPNFQDNIDRPILAIELPKNAEDLRHVVHTDDPHDSDSQCRQNGQECDVARAISGLRANTYQDFLFILMYSSFLWRFSVFFRIARNGKRIRLATTIGYVALLTALFDCAENIGILRTLGATNLTDGLARATAWPSRCKWMFFGLALLLTSRILQQSENPIYSLVTKRLLSIAYAISGVLFWVGLWRPRLIELATSIFALLVLVNVVALLGPYLANVLPEKTPEYVSDFCERKREGRADVAVRPRPST
jgi:uncharacterized membrane protein